MNEPHPELKQLLRAAGEATRREPVPSEAPAGLVKQVLRERRANMRPPATMSLSELLVPRGAAWAALAGLGALGMQFATSGFSLGLLRDGTAPYVLLLRFFLP